MKKFKELTKEELIQAIESVEYLGQVLTILNCTDNSYNRKKLKDFIELNNISTSHIKTKLTKEKYEQNPKYCKYCGKLIPYEKRENDFCNHSCSASFNNIKNENHLPEHSYCLNCGKEITRGNKFCNNTCTAKYKEKEYITRWLNGEESGISGKDDIREPIKHYLFNLHNNSCEKCGWNKINEYTGKVPLQIHHINGDCTNNRLENLQLLCPNCHSLTENFGSRNKNCTRIDKRIR